MTVVERYWEGVLRRLQAEVDILAELVRHPGEKGRENELALVRVLESLAPRRYGVGTGLLVDSQDRFGSQTDIVIFDQGNEPTVFAQTTQLLFPIENVRACVEVKTTLDSDGVKDFANKKSKMLQLQPVPPAEHPLFLLFGYNCGVRPSTLATAVRELPTEQRPDIICLISPGLVGWPGDTHDEYEIGLTGLHETDSVGSRKSGTYVPSLTGVGDYQMHNGSSYPIVDYHGNYCLGEPARALLLFCERLLASLASRDGSPAPTLHHYLSVEARELMLL